MPWHKGFVTWDAWCEHELRLSCKLEPTPGHHAAQSLLICAVMSFPKREGRGAGTVKAQVTLCVGGNSCWPRSGGKGTAGGDRRPLGCHYMATGATGTN